MSALPPTDEALVAASLAAREAAWAPYSGYRVGAAVRGESGRIYGGCNVENASYGLTICAERGAVMNWAAAGGIGVPSTIAVAAFSEDSSSWVTAMPCGACRQVLAELPGSENLSVWIWDGKEGKKMPLSELLPHSFGAADLDQGEE